MLRSIRCRCDLRSRCAAFSSTLNAAGEDLAVAKTKLKAPQKVEVETTWNTVVVGEIADCYPHPQADRLNVCTVNIGDKENLLQIICGASNVRRGVRVPVAKVGTKLVIKEPETGKLKKLKIKKSKLRGEISQGMICSETELGLADESDGIFIFEADVQVGSFVFEHDTIASRLKARGISVPPPLPKADAASLQMETKQSDVELVSQAKCVLSGC